MGAACSTKVADTMAGMLTDTIICGLTIAVAVASSSSMSGISG